MKIPPPYCVGVWASSMWPPLQTILKLTVWWSVHSTPPAQGRLTCRDTGADCLEHLAWVLLGLRAAPKESSALSLTQLVFGQLLILTGELKDVQEAASDHFSSQLQSPDPPPTCQPRSYTDVVTSPPKVPVHLQQAQYVYIRRGGTIPHLAPIYVGPY